MSVCPVGYMVGRRCHAAPPLRTSVFSHTSYRHSTGAQLKSLTTIYGLAHPMSMKMYDWRYYDTMLNQQEIEDQLTYTPTPTATPSATDSRMSFCIAHFVRAWNGLWARAHACHRRPSPITQGEFAIYSSKSVCSVLLRYVVMLPCT